MKSTKNLDLILVTASWVGVYLSSLIFFATFPRPPSFQAYLLTFGSISIFSASVWLLRHNYKFHPKQTGNFSRNKKQLSGLKFGPILLISIIALLVGGALLDYLYNPIRGVGDGNIADIRRVYVDYGAQRSGPLAYFLAATNPLIVVLGILLVCGRYQLILKIIASVAIIIIVILEALSTGGRTTLKLMLFILGATTIINNHASLVKNWKISLFFCIMFSILLFSAFSWYNIYRGSVRKGLDHAAQLSESRGRQILESAGLKYVPTILIIPFNFLHGYALLPIGHLQHFLDVHEIPPRFGLYNFNFIGRRLDYLWLYDKIAIDHYYSDFGITFNVWATAFREIYVDFGFGGTIAFFALLGIIYGYNSRKVDNSFASLYSSVVILSFVLSAPFESLLKIRTFEFCFYLMPLVWFYEYIDPRLRWKLLGAPVAGTKHLHNLPQ
jgi:hypothetical protein